MAAFISILAFVLAAPSGGGQGGFSHFYNEYFNIPGFELWRFLNLAIFIAIMVYLLKKPLSGAFKARREQIRAELIRAEAEKQAALARAAEVDARVASIEAEREKILEQARNEAAEEKRRLTEQTRADVERMRAQAQSELHRLLAQSRAELRRFSAEESVRRAEEKLRAQLDGEQDARLVRAGIQEIGGLN